MAVFLQCTFTFFQWTEFILTDNKNYILDCQMRNVMSKVRGIHKFCL